LYNSRIQERKLYELWKKSRLYIRRLGHRIVCYALLPYLSFLMPTPSSTTPFVETLIALRDLYLAAILTTPQQASYAREQLNHINALLIDQGMPLEAGSLFPPAHQPSAGQNSPAPVVADPIEEKPTPSAKPPHTKSRKAVGKTPAIANPTRSTTPIQAQPGKSSRETILVLLPEFTGMSKTAAVAQVIADHSGQTLHLDDIIRLLHGTLDEFALREERKRMRTILWQGVERQRWERVKGKDAHYTLSNKLLSSATRSKGKSPGKPAPAQSLPSQRKQTGKVKSEPIPVISGSLMGAVEKVLADNRGIPMRAEAIAEVLYGKLSPARFLEVKKQISDRLAKGVKTQRWQRVSKQVGVYVLP
jgi:hypothetical protein